MKVLNLRCAHDHGFEGWFASDDDFSGQLEQGLVECPVCGDTSIARLPSAPRLNFGATQEVPKPPQQAVTMQKLWVDTMREVLSRTEDVGARFPEEARRIHYGEIEARGIRGQADARERAALEEEGIEIMSLPVPPMLKGPAH